MSMVIGVISDTHGMLREQAVRELRDVDMIIHAGDIGNPAVLDALGRIAPVRAIRGNVDAGPWAAQLPQTAIVEAEGLRAFVIHNVAELEFDPAERQFSAVIFGHSHKAACEYRNGVLCLNPGSAGPRRFRLPVSLARLTVNGGSVHADIITLQV